jgi:SAM-dependent methyltransferase
MSRLLGEHTIGSAMERLLHLLRSAGVSGTISILCSAADDKYLRTFDRWYGVKTSGFLRLTETGFDPARLADATQYGPVSGWGLKQFLKELNLPQISRFVDLGSGLGRACLLAADYGFSKVTGVELAPELCAGAKQNIARFRSANVKVASIEILQMDVLDYCRQTQDDVFFMFRPFSLAFTHIILDKLAERARLQGKTLTIIYSERMLLPGSFAGEIAQHPACRKVCEAARHGQSFFVYQCGVNPV